MIREDKNTYDCLLAARLLCPVLSGLKNWPFISSLMSFKLLLVGIMFSWT
jgi:hypothetical protein